MHFSTWMSPILFIILFLSMVETKFYRPFQFGPSPHHDQGKPTSRHKNHCAYVVEKTVSFTVQDGAAPYVKAEYNKCSWGQKCPTLQYRLMYKPMYKVAHKTVTELEWRCCPGYSGYGCMEGHPIYQHSVKSMPPFNGPSMKGPPMKGPPMKGPPMKGPPMKGPTYKGPMFKGPMFKGPPIKSMMKANPWSQPNGHPPSGFHSYPVRHFGPPSPSSYPDPSFESFPPQPEAEPMPDHQEAHHPEHEQEHEHGHEHSLGPEEHIPEEIPPPPSGGEQPEGEPIGHTLDSDTEDRIFRMEEDVHRLNQGLETLRGTVNGLEDKLRASLREDANRMLSALLSAAPSPVSAPAVSSGPSNVGFVEIPGGDPSTEGLDGRHVLPGLTELNGRVEELRAELQAKTTELQELKATVMGHDGALKRMSSRAGAASHAADGLAPGAVEKLMDAKLSEARTEILGGFEKRIESAEGRCEEKAGDVRRQCQREQTERQEQMEDALEGGNTEIRTELRNLQAQIHGLKTSESCCTGASGLVERVQYLETSVAGLNQSQGHLRVALSGHRDHIEGMLEGRLGYVEEKLNLTGKIKREEPERSIFLEIPAPGQGLETKMEGKLKALEHRFLTALEELGNVTAPALLEGHAVPALETELESLQERLEVDVDRLQKQLSGLEKLCSSSCSSPQTPAAIQGDSAAPSAKLAKEQELKDALDLQDDRLSRLNATLHSILRRLTFKDQVGEGHPIQGELTILKFNISSVNSTLKGLQDSLGTVAKQVGQANSSWHEREARLAQQIKGVVQLVGHQASMLGAGERRLTRLKGELQDMRRRLAEEVKGCRSTAMGVQKEVTEVGGRVANVEDKCKGLNLFAEDLERIREELEGQSNGLLLQVNGTLSSHAQQLSELRAEVRNCTSKAEPTPQTLELETELKRGDTFKLTKKYLSVQVQNLCVLWFKH